jgi:tetratricopeptide (TPR) repeat protein
MRLPIVLRMALAIAFISVGVSAQDSGINPLRGQIREQEMAVDRAPGKSDGKAWLKLAVLRQDAAQYRDSERAYRRAISLLKFADRLTLADALDRMGTMYVERGQFAKAEPLEQKALAIRENANDALGVGISHMHLSVLLLGNREFSAAEAEAEMAVSLLVPKQTLAAPGAANPEDKMAALIDLAMVRCARHACATAVPELRRALRIAHMSYTANSIPVGFLDFLLGYALWKSGDNDSAGDLMRKGTQELSIQLGWGHPTYLGALRQYRIFLTQVGHTTEADEVRDRIANLERSPGIARVESAQVPMGFDQLH